MTFHQIENKPRVYVLQPQRLFMETIRQILEADFQIVGTGECASDVLHAQNLDLIIIDADAMQLSEAFLVDVARESGAIVCMLLLKTPRCAKRDEPAHRIQVIPKSLTQHQFIETLVRIAANASYRAATATLRS